MRLREDDDGLELPDGFYPAVVVPAIGLGVLAWRMCPRIIGVNGFYGLSLTAAWTLMWTHLVVIFVDYGNEFFGAPGSEPSEGFSTFDTDGLKKFWPTFYWVINGYAQVFSLIVLYEKSGYLSWFSKIKGCLIRFLMYRVPVVIFGAFFCLLSLKVLGINKNSDDAAEADKVAADSDEQAMGVLFVGFLKVALNVSGLIVYCVMLGIGLASFPFFFWFGTTSQQLAWYTRKCIKLQNTVTFATKKLRNAKKAGEEERDTLPVSDPAYTLYVAVLQNPADPFNADIAFAQSQDPNFTSNDEDPDAHEERKKHLENLNGRDHEEIARVREAILEANYDLILAEYQASKADKRREELLSSQNTGFSPIAIAGGVIAALTGIWSAWMIWFQVMGPIVASNELEAEISGFPDTFDNGEDVDRGFVLSLIYLYYLVVTGWAILEYRRWFGIFSLGFLFDSVLGSVLRFTEMWLYLINPWTYQFVVLFRMWFWDAEEEPDLAYEDSYSDMALLPFFGDIFTRWTPFLVAIVAISTLFLNLPAKVQNFINRHKLHEMYLDDFQRKKNREEATKNSSAAGAKSDFGIFGNPVEGSELTASGEIVSSSIDVRSCDYEWARKKPEESEWQVIPGAASETYTPTADDIGYLLQCTATPRSETGEEGSPVSAHTTEKIKIALPSIRNLRIEGGPYHTAGYRIRGDYVGGIEGDSIKQWFKVKGGITTGISGATDFVYQPSIDDVACTLKVEYTPVREDGRKGTLQIAESHPLKIDPSVGKMVKNYIVAGGAEFEIVFIDKGMESKRLLIVNDKQLKMKDRKTIKFREDLGPHLSVVLEPSDSKRFKVIVDGKNSVDCKAENHKERDIIALTIRSFIVMAGDRKDAKGKK